MTTATKQGHTPGPWHVEDAPDSGLIFIRSHPAEVSLANIRKGQDRPNEANARLIAAAPELLEALQSILFQAGCREARDLGNLNYDRLHAVEAQARAAIACATGQGEGRP